ncbi:MAG: AraC family transcriptional regulator [Cyanobacteria bacterium P01_F01_bin.86]
MAIPFSNQESDYWHCGSHNDPRLLHSDSSDQIRILSPQVGEGYIQEIPLQEGLSLVVMDYSVHSIFAYTTARRSSPHLEFEFCLHGQAAGQASFIPHLDLQEICLLRSAHPRRLKVEVMVRHSMYADYSQTLLEHLPSQDKALLLNWASQVYRSQRGYSAKSPQTALDTVLSGDITSPQMFCKADPFECLDFGSLGRTWQFITSEMHQLLSQILSCPSSGQIRRTYLQGKVLQLIDLVLLGLNHSKAALYPLSDGDLDRIYQAGKILACSLNNPPSVEILTRQVGLNRLKLNQGFHQVYGTTPFRYLRRCRLGLAEHLLTTSDLPTEVIAHKVGYASRSNFAGAFRQWRGVNPKELQIHSRNLGRVIN